MDINPSRGQLARRGAHQEERRPALTLLRGGHGVALAYATAKVERSTQQLRDDCAALARLLRAMR